MARLPPRPRLTRQRSQATLLVTPFTRLSRKDTAALTAEGARLLAFTVADADAYDVRFAEPQPDLSTAAAQRSASGRYNHLDGLAGRIHSDPKILSGKPVARGTRLSVEFLLSLFAAGQTEEEVLEGYPHLKRDDLGAVFAYVAELYQCSVRSITESSDRCPGGVDT